MSDFQKAAQLGIDALDELMYGTSNSTAVAAQKYENAKEALRAALAAEPLYTTPFAAPAPAAIPPGWIKCSEQMPPNSGEFVLVATRNGCVGEALYEDGKWPDAIDVTHWMPLPPVPSPVLEDSMEELCPHKERRGQFCQHCTDEWRGPAPTDTVEDV